MLYEVITIFSGNLAEMESFNEDGIVIVLDQDIPYDSYNFV